MTITENDRKIMFWVACIPVRLFIGVFATFLSFCVSRTPEFLLLGFMTAIVSVGFFVNILRFKMGLKKQGNLGGKIWWNKQRYIHFCLYLLSSITSFYEWKYSGLLLIIDAILAVIFGIYHFFSVSN